LILDFRFWILDCKKQKIFCGTQFFNPKSKIQNPKWRKDV